jgi:hypothetical protein
MNQTFRKRTYFSYNHCLLCLWKANAPFIMLSFSFVYGECCMLLSGVCFFLFVCVMFRDWSSSWESRYILWKYLQFPLSKASGLLTLHILLEPNQHMITKFTFMICIIWWVAYSDTHNLSNLTLCLTWDYDLIKYLCWYSYWWYYCSKW